MKKQGDMNKFYYAGFPAQAVLVTCKNDNVINVITIAWHMPISKKPGLYGVSVSPKRFSHQLLHRAKEFTVNFAPLSLVKKVHFCGTHSGKQMDKIKEIGLTLLPADRVSSPIIKECFAHLECKLFDEIPLGDHTLFVGGVVNVSVDENFFKNGFIDNKNIKPCYYMGENSYTTISDEVIRF